MGPGQGSRERLELRAADRKAKLKSLAGLWDVINPRSAWLGGPEVTATCPGSLQDPSGFWEEMDFRKWLGGRGMR